MHTLSKSCRKILEIMKPYELYSAQEIHTCMRVADPKAPGLSTTYRSLEILLRYKYLQVIVLGDGERRYELISPGEHHHHLICEMCGRSVHLPECAIDNIRDRIASSYGFKIKEHVLEIFGKCGDCLAIERDTTNVDEF